ncbi:extracellular solute-binding protein [Plantactinospora sp. KBS50]|uniref:extracellular solute-binding protein n=1 Tax=Plantactinospora sp. KBS50 TaxID=2024580 RepID=UPI000BAAD4AA|nr:extracellular solute-binding protein [Plantactinospora sp. KBS50]ASW53776.1 ABC transporter substrate-binding protein [Plantactinospora sp. KBS50]
MRKGYRTWIAASSAVLAASLALTGCGSGGEQKTADGRTVVTFWQQKFEDYQQAWFKKQVDTFNTNQTKIKVDLQVVPADTWPQKLKAAQAAGKAPDIATTNYGNIPAAVANGELAELDGLLPTEAFDDIKDNVRSFVTINGKHYAYPMLVEPSTVLYYRTDLAEAAGLDPAKPPASWAELDTWAAKLTQGKVKGMTIASAAPDLGWSSWGLQYNACGHLPVADDWSKSVATEPCFERLLGLYKGLYQGGYMPKQPKVGYADGTPYGQGEVAMMAGGSWVVGQLKNEFPKMIEKTAVAPFPSVDGDPSRTTATLGGWTLTVDAKSKAKQDAAEFVAWLLAGEPAIMADFFKASGFSKYTVRTSVDEALASNADASADPFMKIISERVVPNGKAEPAYPWDISLAFGTAIESAMKGGSDAPAALRKADAAINDVIKKQSLAGTAPTR